MLRLPIVLVLIFLAVSLSRTVAANIICDKCGQPIPSGQEIHFNGKYYHRQCLICDDCGKPLDVAKGAIIQGDKYYHADCFYRNVRKWCYVCGQWIEGSYCVDPWGHPYHKWHDGVHPRCEYCGRFITQEVTEGGIYYDDGRIICHLCLQSAIANQDSASAILEAVRDTLGTIGINIDSSGISIRLLGKDTMEKRFGEHYGNPDGMTRVYYDAVSGDPEYRLYLLYGMPKVRFITAVAHELMHVWLFRNQDPAISNNYQGNKLLIEGSCNIAAYLVLQHYAGEEVRVTLRMIEQNRILHYGLGFHETDHYLVGHDTGQWLEYIKTHSRYPPVSSN